MWRWLLGRRSSPAAPDDLPEDARIEVMLDGVCVGILTDRKFVDMFWYSYQVTPLDVVITDDELWNRCRFTFRDPGSGKLCSSAPVGGRPPFVRDGRIVLRAMYF
jgi:hypothetical protein